MRASPSGLIVVSRASMYRVLCLPEARVNWPRRAERVARRSSRRSRWSVRSMREEGGERSAPRSWRDGGGGRGDASLGAPCRPRVPIYHRLPRRVAPHPFQPGRVLAYCDIAYCAIASPHRPQKPPRPLRAAALRPPRSLPAVRPMRLRPSTAALFVVIVFVFGGLTAAERAFMTADRLHVEGEAQQAAERVRGFVALHDAALGALQGLLVDPDAPATDSLRVASLIEGVREHAPALRRVWIAAANGGVLYDVLLDSTTRPVGVGAAPALGPRTTAGLREAARASRRPRFSALGVLHTGERGIALVKPVYVGRRFLGVVGGTIAVANLGTLVPPRAGDAAAVFLVAGADTLTLVAPAARRGSLLPGGLLADDILARREAVRLPGGQRWLLTVTQIGRASCRERV